MENKPLRYYITGLGTLELPEGERLLFAINEIDTALVYQANDANGVVVNLIQAIKDGNFYLMRNVYLTACGDCIKTYNNDNVYVPIASRDKIRAWFTRNTI